MLLPEKLAAGAAGLQFLYPVAVRTAMLALLGGGRTACGAQATVKYGIVTCAVPAPPPPPAVHHCTSTRHVSLAPGSGTTTHIMEPTSVAAYVGSTNGLEEAGRFNNRMMRGFTSQGGTQRNIEAEAEAVLRHIEQGAEQRAGQDAAPGAGKAEGEVDKLGPIQYSEDSRQTSAEDINWTVTIIANSIKLVSAVLTILAAESTDRLVSTELHWRAQRVGSLPRIVRQKSAMGALL